MESLLIQNMGREAVFAAKGGWGDGKEALYGTTDRVRPRQAKAGTSLTTASQKRAISVDWKTERAHLNAHARMIERR